MSKNHIKPRAEAMRAQITIDRSRDALLTDFGKQTLDRSYLMPGEGYQDAFARVAGYFADDAAHAQRLYDYISKLWFMPATPVLSNGGTSRGLPISCFLNDCPDSLKGIVDNWNENIWLARHGGGIGTYYGDVRSIGENVGVNGKTTGVVPFIKVQDSLTLAISQGSLRRGSAAMYLPVWHPEIEEFMEIRRPTGGDPNRKALNLHNGVVVDDVFMMAVESGGDYHLRSPADGHIVKTVKARDIWIRLLTARMETGEPYILFIDTVKHAQPAHQKELGLWVKQSNLCVEITLPTGIDFQGVKRTAVCCLSSLNLETYNEWADHKAQVIEDVLRFLDNILTDFCDSAPEEFANAIYSAKRERSVGLGVMGFHSYLQKSGIPIESPAALKVNELIFATLKHEADKVNTKLAHERGPCLDAAERGYQKRFSNMFAIAPTASISIICGQTSPAIEPWSTNAFVQKTLSGTFQVRNKYLREVLIRNGLDLPEVWSSIIANGGSVQHLDELSDWEKAIFKTAFEIDQRALIKLAGGRQPYICQAQSLNIFLPGNVNKKDLHEIHMLAWKEGVKSLYYCRTKAVNRAENVSQRVAQTQNVAADALLNATKEDLRNAMKRSGIALKDEEPTGLPAELTTQEECLACQ